MKHAFVDTTPLSLPNPWWIKLLSVVLSNPYINWAFRGTFVGICGYVGSLRKQRKSQEAIEYILDVLLHKPELFVNKPQRWWFLMRLAFTIFQEEILKGRALPEELLLEAYELGSEHPAFGYDAAFCLIGFSLWLFQKGDLRAALACSAQAIEACPSWAYTHYLKGWLSLFEPKVDPFEPFAHAIELEPNIIARILSDPVCQLFPELLKRLQSPKTVRRNI